MNRGSPLNGYEQEIASALREMADQAATPLPRIEAAWRAGRRRRRNTMTASAAGAAGVTAVAALIPMAVAGGTASPGSEAAGSGGCGGRTGPSTALKAYPAPSRAVTRAWVPIGYLAGSVPPVSPASPPTASPVGSVPTASAAAPITVSPTAPPPTACPAPSIAMTPVTPPSGSAKTAVPAPPLPQVRLQQVAKVVHEPCPRGSHGMPGTSKRVCYYLTTKEMLLALKSVKVVRTPGALTAQGQPVYTVLITLQPGEIRPLNALISQVMHQASPRNELAWITDGRVVTSPVAERKLPATFQLTASSGLAAQQQLARELQGQGKPLFVPTGPASGS
jgi:hypothetical protein